jgi:hypothetical protein
MSKSNRKNPKAKGRDPVAENGSKVIKGGTYDGSHSSSDFIVSGHSTGSANTEMEALSHQVSLDAGVVPAYSTESDIRSDTVISNKNVLPVLDNSSDVDDLGGPMLYGPSPTLLKERPLQTNKTSRRTLLWSTLGIGAVAVIGYIAYKFYADPQLRKTAMPNFLKTQSNDNLPRSTSLRA